MSEIVFDAIKGTEPLLREVGVVEDSIWQVLATEEESAFAVRIDKVERGATISPFEDRTIVFYHRFFEQSENPALFETDRSLYNAFARVHGNPCGMSGKEVLIMINSGRMRIKPSPEEIIQGL